MENYISMKKTIAILLLAGIISSCVNRPSAQSHSESSEQQAPQQKEAGVQTEIFDSLVAMFPEWVEDSINIRVFDSKIEQFPYERTIPRGLTDIYFPLNEEERSMASHFGYSACHRIERPAFYILFVKKDLDEHDINDSGGYPYCSCEVMTFSTNGTAIDKMEVARFGDFWCGTLSGTRQPLCLHLEKCIKTDWEGGFTFPFPISIDEIEVRFATNGKILADTLRSYISYANGEEITDGVWMYHWNRNEEEPIHE